MNEFTSWGLNVCESFSERTQEDDVNVVLTLKCVVCTFQGLEALQASGKVRSIGVSNFSILQLQRLMALCRVPPAVNQVRMFGLVFGVETEML